MAIYVYKISDGSLVSSCQNDTDPVAPNLAALGLASVSGLLPLDATHVWQTSTHSVVVVVPPTPTNLVNTFDFIMAFTASELAAIRASSNTGVQQFLFAFQVTQGVNLNSTTIQNSLNSLVTLSLLTAPRATAILATVRSSAAGG